MAKDSAFYRFPLCLLSEVRSIDTPVGLRAVLLNARAWAMANAGNKLSENLEEYQVKAIVDNGGGLATGFDGENDDHLLLGLGKHRTGSYITCYPEEEKRMNRARAIVEAWEGRHGGDSFVDLRGSLIDEFLTGSGSLTARDISTYCGICAAIGKKKYGWVTHKRIIAGAHGCKSWNVFEAAIGEPWVTLDQIRGAIHKLERRGFIASAIWCKRKAYSIRSHGELTQLVRSEIANKIRIREARKPVRISLGGDVIKGAPESQNPCPVGSPIGQP